MRDYSVITHRAQGSFKKVLCICSAGILRSATAAVVLAGEPFGFNTRSAGAMDYALIPVTEALLLWADEIVMMAVEHYQRINFTFPDLIAQKEVKILGIPDDFEYRDPQLIDLIRTKYHKPEWKSS